MGSSPSLVGNDEESSSFFEVISSGLIAFPKSLALAQGGFDLSTLPELSCREQISAVPKYFSRAGIRARGC